MRKFENKHALSEPLRKIVFQQKGMVEKALVYHETCFEFQFYHLALQQWEILLTILEFNFFLF